MLGKYTVRKESGGRGKVFDRRVWEFSLDEAEKYFDRRVGTSFFFTELIET